MARLINQFSWILLGRLLAAGIQAGTLVLLARALSLTDFGLLTGVLGVTVVLQAMADLGIAKLLIRERARDTDSAILAGGLRLNSWLTFILFVLLLIGFFLIGLLYDDRFLLMIPLAISAAGEKNADTWLGVAIADGDVRLNSTNLVTRRLITLGVFMLSLSLNIAPILSYTTGAAVGAVISVVFSRKVVSGRVKNDYSNIRETFNAAFPFWVNSLVSQLRNLDSALVGLISGTVTAGYYSAAARLTSPMRMLPDSLAQVLLPYATRSRKKSVFNLFRLVLVFSLAMAFIYSGLALIMPWAVPLLLGTDYIPAITAIQIVLIGLVFSSLNSLLRSIMQGRGMQKEVAILAVIVTTYILSFIVILTPFFGAVGAALALSSGFFVEVVGSLVIIFFVERKAVTAGVKASEV